MRYDAGEVITAMVTPFNEKREVDYDKVEGDNILQRMCGIIDIDCELDAVQLKKYSRVRKI